MRDIDMIDEQKFEKAIRAKLAQHECDVKSDMWATIEARLPQKKAPKVPVYRRVAWYSAAAAVVGAIVTLALWQSPEQPLDTPVALNEQSQTTEIVKPLVQEANKIDASPRLAYNTHDEVAMQSRQSSAQKARQKTIIAENTPADMSIKTEKANSQNSRLNTQESVAATKIADQELYRQKLAEFENEGKQLKENTLVSPPENGKKSKGIKLGLMASNSLSGDGQNSPTAIRTRNPLFLAKRNPVYKFEHRIPLSVGITAAKDLGRNWELESGLVYTYLYSKYYSTNGNGSQELHYLGIPLDVIYRFARIKRASFYASAGGQVDFYLAGRQKDEGHDTGISGSGYKKLKHENVQFSVQAKVGAALTLYKQTELYLEPHIAYYIENNSSIHNIWKDKPFNFGLTLGLRTGF